MPRMFLSYRRADAAAITGRIFDRLVARYGRDVVFMDIDDIPIGTDFKKYVDGVLRKCDILLAVVGTKWLGAEVVGTPRIFNEADPVRNELLSALRLNIPIIPVLVDGAKMPEAKDLPNDLTELAARNATEVSSGRDFDVHTKRLIRSIDRIVAETSKRPEREEFAVKLQASSGPTAAKTKRAKSKSWFAYLLTNVATPAILVAFAHYLVVLKLNMNYDYLRIAAIIIPLFAGFFLFWYYRQSPGSAFVLGAAVGIISVAWMLVIVGLVDKVPIVPSTLLDWQESVEYFVSMTLSMAMGNLLAHLFLKIKGAIVTPRRPD